MGLIADWVASLGGFARKRELARRGARDHHLTDAVRTGEVLRARNGWYSTADPDSDEFRAVRVGGRMTGGSALFAAGAWMRSRPPLAVSVPRNASRQRSPHDRRVRRTRHLRFAVSVHWDNVDVAARGSRTTVDIRDAFAVYLRDVPFEEAVAALDWGLVTCTLDRTDFEELIRRLPRRLRVIRDWVDDRCGSYQESIERTRLRLEGLRVRSQVALETGAAIDLLIEETIGMEVDGRRHHESRFEYDRAKDLDIALKSWHAMRVSPTIIRRRWTEVVTAIRLALRARGLSPPLPRHEVHFRLSTRLIGTRAEFDLPPLPSLLLIGHF